MKARLICAALLVIGMGAMGCGAVPEPPLACSDQEPGWSSPWGLSYCQALGMECNEAVTVADECPAFVVELEGYIRNVLVPMLSDRLSFLPSFINVDELVAMLFEQYVGVCGQLEALGQYGTCQPLGDLGNACAEDADCIAGLGCVAGTCAVPPEPECVVDADCAEGFVCLEEACVEVEPADETCEDDEDCPEGFTCEEGDCEPLPV